MTHYEHKQSGWTIIVALCAVAALCLLIASFFPAPYISFFIAFLLLVISWLFSSLLITIDDDKLTWTFGPGLIRKRVMLSQIQTVRVIRTSWYDGWGIHFTRNGWLYNVAGRDAVAIQLKSGKRFVLGTDEPDILFKALSEQIAT